MTHLNSALLPIGRKPPTDELEPGESVGVERVLGVVHAKERLRLRRNWRRPFAPPPQACSSQERAEPSECEGEGERLLLPEDVEAEATDLASDVSRLDFRGLAAEDDERCLWGSCRSSLGVGEAGSGSSCKDGSL
mmetsp:Transcript_144102/g.461317  ORF Transcript_144102/g.461317 Transcript_144102/m.461317 type:complete len:135 (+) Transcript_144102:953-1357(+)